MIYDKIVNYRKGNMAKKNINTENTVNQTKIVKPKTVKISADTQIVFTVKGFLTTIGTILMIFYGFYQIVIIPRMDSTESHYKEMYDDQKKQNKVFYQNFGEIKTSIGSLNASIDELNREIISHDNEKDNNNSGGSFGKGLTKSNDIDTTFKIKFFVKN
jgi:hypothetical protein